MPASRSWCRSKRSAKEQFQQSFALNVTAVFFLTQKLLPYLTPGDASVINISSYFANKMIPKRPSSVYSLSKGALNSLTKSLAFELGPRGIRVNAIAPGTVDTAMRRKTVDNLPDAAKAELSAYVERSYPLGRIGRPDDLGGIAVYLASDEASVDQRRHLCRRRRIHGWVTLSPGDISHMARKIPGFHHRLAAREAAIGIGPEIVGRVVVGELDQAP